VGQRPFEGALVVGFEEILFSTSIQDVYLKA